MRKCLTQFVFKRLRFGDISKWYCIIHDYCVTKCLCMRVKTSNRNLLRQQCFHDLRYLQLSVGWRSARVLNSGVDGVRIGSYVGCFGVRLTKLGSPSISPSLFI